MAEISVIIPVYNVEKYLERCIHSVLNQNFKDYEILLIDDGSTDSCAKICDKYTNEEKIRVFHKENGGLSDARNYGLERANGKYVTYIDSDDYVSSDYLMYLYDLIKKNDADMSCCGYIRTDKSNEEFMELEKKSEVLTGREACAKMLDDPDFTLVVAWAKLIKKEIAQKHLFPKGRLHEDVPTTFKFYLECDKVAIGERKLYGYFINYQGIQLGTISLKRREDELWSVFYRVNYLKENKEFELYKQAVLFAALRLKEVLMWDLSQREHWEKYYREIMKSNCIKPAIKVKLFTIMKLPFIVVILKKIKE